MQTEKLPKSKLKLLYIDILRGFSSFDHPRYNIIYVKHFTTLDVGDVDVRYESFYQKAVSEGLPTYKDREEYLLKDGIWTPEKENMIFEYKKYVEGLRLTKSKTFRTTEINQLNKKITETENQIQQLENEKNLLINFTAELFAAKRINEYHIFHSLFKDENCSNHFLSEEDFNDIDEDELSDLVDRYNKVTSLFSDYNLKRVALLPSFFNLFGLSENAYEFYGKPIVHLTFYQSELYGHARYFKGIFSSGKRPPDNLLDEPDKLIEWYEATQSAEEMVGKNKNGNNPSSLVGLSKEDRERLGMNNDDSSNSLNKLVEAAKKNGGEIGMAGIMQIIK